MKNCAPVIFSLVLLLIVAAVSSASTFKGYVLCENSCTQSFMTGAKTFTPTVTLVGGAGNTTPVYTENHGRYWQLGNIVMVEVHLDGDGGDEGAGSGQVHVALPLAAGASALTDFVPIGHIHNGAVEKIILGEITPSESVIGLYVQDSAAQTASLTGVDQNNTTRELKFQFFYEID